MTPSVPSRLERLPELAYNLLWTWRPETRRLFARLDEGLWEETEHNPVRLLRETENLESAAESAAFVDAYHHALRDLDAYLGRRDTWMARLYRGLASAGPVAYFSAEFGLHEALPIYSGGLGVLAGDHVKSASDLGVPLVGVGILYAQGYFRQRLDAQGRQQEVYEPFEPDKRPILPARDPDGGEVMVSVGLPGRELHLKVWEARVGRVSVLLLDADVPENSGENRDLTARLYGGDSRTRIAQEVILGVGGVRALRAAGVRPSVFHMNEGHAAFCGLERMREMTSAGRGFEEARERVAGSAVFTTHTPVPAGHDAFAPDLFWEFMGGLPEALGASGEDVWSLGHRDESWGRAFNMTVLAVNLSTGRNAVSRLHGEVSREMWGYLFSENGSAGANARGGITHVTNGVHTWSWLAPELADLFEQHSGGRAWRDAVEEQTAWSFVSDVPDGELWETHRRVKRRTVEFINSRLELQRQRSGGALQTLDPDALTIGFARRFATYKRATLLLSDPDRLKRIVEDSERPVQFVFAGKAHPADEPAKNFIRELYRAAEGELSDRLIVLEDYDMNVTCHLVQGVDVWLNNPRRPLEASGTSGQKAALNGAPNFSVLDGWWPEAYNGHNGWAIGEEQEYASQEEQDAADAESLYRILEESLVPLYYARDGKGIPRGWTGMMKEAIGTIAPMFSTQRMVRDYVHKLYVPRTAGSPVTR